MEFTLTVEPDLPKGFMGLPRELRDVIYEYTLIEDSLWDKRHSALCQNTPRVTEKWEEPAWVDWQYDYEPCSCSRRKGLGLLQVCRQIHNEAAPIFWSKNHFCFRSAPGLMSDIGEDLRPKYRPLLRSISLMCLGGTMGEHKLDLWSVLSQCTGLRSVEIDIEHARGYNYKMGPLMLGLMEEERRVERKTKKSQKPLLPNLENFSLAKFWTWNIRTPTWQGPRYQFEHLYVKVARPVDRGKMKDLASLRDVVRDFETNFLVHARHAFDEDLIDEEMGRMGYQLKRKLEDSDTELTLKLRDETETTVRLYGMPISKETRMRNAKARRFADAELRRQGKLTSAEERAKDNVEDQRQKRKEMLAEKRSKETETVSGCTQRCYVCREYKNERTQERNEKIQKKEREEEVAEKKRDVNRNREVRKMERKRIGRKGGKHEGEDE